MKDHTNGIATDRFVYTAREAAAIARVNEKTIRRLIARGKLRKCESIRHIRIPRQSLEDLLNNKD
jgi:excisionase family DNA binding protein